MPVLFSKLVFLLFGKGVEYIRGREYTYLGHISVYVDCYVFMYLYVDTTYIIYYIYTYMYIYIHIGPYLQRH